MLVGGDGADAADDVGDGCASPKLDTLVFSITSHRRLRGHAINR
jgi:hypothetical protein